ncbi:metalloregulator ArsR/SmtB family transcription factor [Bacillus lacus]|uniref:Metalloregulator ArsR/SmtB family transcription factor n=1 Tax=Metabacillus lacus TaxID=1983721 RepID=A0A7X2J285_9BACI|nr:metalloregulator ArsR/SmtB family transcription factor [Metabacillus lacus]MRX73303.1 metalloregulator ArsR/SmtB family transcription factor [Metabacillus lacus]
MQLNKLVEFHKVMGDPTRIRIVTLLASGPKHGQAIAGILGLTAPTISHHLGKLRALNLIEEKRVKNSIYFALHHNVYDHYAAAVGETVRKGGDEEMSAQQGSDHMILRNYLTKEGKLKVIPSQRKRKLIVLRHIVEEFEPGRKYPEKEINEYLLKYHEDFATLRRELIMNSMMYREDGIYELNPKEMWNNID